MPDLGPVTPPQSSPYVYEIQDGWGRNFRISIYFEVLLTRLITGMTAYREPSCVYTTWLLGLGPDGTPDTTDKRIGPLAEGTTLLTGSQLEFLLLRGVGTIDQFYSYQITAI